MKLTVSNNQRTMLRDEKHFFYLADTCWSAFSNIRDDEWPAYLEKRKNQGFNTLQINILPQWDRSTGDFEILPFVQKDGRFDFSKFDDTYFERAQKMCQLAQENGFSLSLVVLWSNYVTGTWASTLDQEKNIFPSDMFDAYFERIINYFDKFSPIYFIGGDTDFPTQKTVETYLTAFEYFEKNSPNTLKTIHVNGRLSEIPKEIVNYLDIYLYQSGHDSTFPDVPFSLAETFYNMIPQLPIINSEPCYEQMALSRDVYGRFGQREVRQAAWQSILSGACAGITYGAHGIWSWHTMISKFGWDIGEGFFTPTPWQNALQYPGATDYGYIKQLFELLKIENLIPKNHLLININSQIRMASTTDENMFLIYLPSNTDLNINFDFSNFTLSLIDLKTSKFYKPNYTVNNKETFIPLHTCEEDVLIIAQL